MSEPDPKERLDALEAKLAARRQAEAEANAPKNSGLSQADLAWRMVTELVAGVGLGFGIGYGLDTVFGSTPWLMVIFTFLGVAAGINVLMRTAREAQAQAVARDAEALRSDRLGTDDSDEA